MVTTKPAVALTGITHMTNDETVAENLLILQQNLPQGGGEERQR